MAFANLNVRSRPLIDAWYSPEMNTLRNEMLSKPIPEECEGVCHPIMLLPTEGIKSSIQANRGLLERIRAYLRWQ